jgi:hypothetical protein
MDATASNGEARPIRRAEIGRGVDAAAEALRLAKNRAPDVAILSSVQSFTVQEGLARVVASGIRQEELLTRIAVALESSAVKPKGA